MSLTDDQRALLHLLLAGDTYEQVGQVTGASPEDVRARAQDAADELERDPDPDLPATAVRTRLGVLDGDVPVAPAAPSPAPEVHDRRRLLVQIFAIGAVLLLVVVVALTLLGGGDESPSQQADVPGEDLVVVRLQPVGSSAASGSVTLARIADQPAVELNIQGLEPSGARQTYVFWFVASSGQSLPIAFQAVGQEGTIKGRTPIPSAATGLLPNFDTAELTLTGKDDAANAITTSAKSGTLPQPIGTTVLRGSLRG